jgi:hypothetical protein
MFKKRAAEAQATDSKPPENSEGTNIENRPRRSKSISATISSKLPFRRKTVDKTGTATGELVDLNSKPLKSRIVDMHTKKGEHAEDGEKQSQNRVLVQQPSSTTNVLEGLGESRYNYSTPIGIN